MLDRACRCEHLGRRGWIGQEREKEEVLCTIRAGFTLAFIGWVRGASGLVKCCNQISFYRALGLSDPEDRFHNLVCTIIDLRIANRHGEDANIIGKPISKG